MFFVTYEELYNAYKDCLKNKKMTANAAAFQVNALYNLNKLYNDLNNNKYDIGKSIAFIVEKPVKREVFAADFRDRIVHHIIINRIIKYFEAEVIDNSFSCRVGKGTLCAIKTLQKEMIEATDNYTKTAYIMKCDLKSFFMTISKEKLYEKIEKLISDKVHPTDTIQREFLCGLVKKVIFNNPQDNCIRKQKIKKWDGLPKNKSLFYVPRSMGLPIGNYTSQIFANYFLNEFDHFIYDTLGFKYYGRYVDDFYIISESKEKLLNSLPHIRMKLDELGVKLHPNKFYIQSTQRGVSFVGGIVKPNRTYIINRTVNNLKNVINEYNVSNKTIEELQHYISSFNSYFGFMIHHKTYKIRKKMIKRMNNIHNYCIMDVNVRKLTLRQKIPQKH